MVSGEDAVNRQNVSVVIESKLTDENRFIRSLLRDSVICDPLDTPKRLVRRLSPRLNTVVTVSEEAVFR
jgi:chromosome segregation ATPase